MVRMTQPQYALLGMERIVSYRPDPEKVFRWHTVGVRNGRVDNLQTIAAENGVPASTLIEFNFPASTRNGVVDPGIVNWYLYHHVDFKCRSTTQDGNNYLFKGGERIAVPFLGRVDIGDPVLPQDRIARMTFQEKLGEAMERSLPHLPDQARSIVRSMLKPETLALIAATLAVWAGSHFFGVGEIVDVVLLGIGVVTIGFAVFEGAGEFYEFTKGAMDAKSDRDLDRAGEHFARAVTLLGIATVQALLMRGPVKAAAARGTPAVRPRIKVSTPPTGGNRLQLSRPAQIPGGSLGVTTEYGVIEVARNQSLTEQRITLLHELVHRFFSPRTGPLLRLRAELNISSYMRSALLKYLEEALAEGYAQLRVHGLAEALAAYRFPVQGGYVTVSQLIVEGSAIGSIISGGVLLRVSVALGRIPD